MNIFSQQHFTEIKCDPQALRHFECATQPAKFEDAVLWEVAEQHLIHLQLIQLFYVKLDFRGKWRTSR